MQTAAETLPVEMSTAKALCPWVSATDGMNEWWAGVWLRSRQGPLLACHLVGMGPYLHCQPSSLILYFLT